MANKILKYTSKDYDSIKKDLIDSISSLTPNWTSREEGDPGIVLVKLMSALGDMLSFNFDKQALEYYAPTVTQRKNAAKLFELVGYKMHWYQAASTTVTITNQATLPEYIYYCKQVYDLEQKYNVGTMTEQQRDSSLVDLYYEYRVRYNHNANEPDYVTNYGPTLSVPPVTNQDGTEIRPPESMLKAGKTYQNTRWLIKDEGQSDYTQSPPVSVKMDPEFINHAINYFRPFALEVYEYWKKDNVIPLHTYIDDKSLSIELYSRDYGSLPYSLIPTTVNPGTVPGSGEYNPTIELYPYTSINLKAIQGSIKSITFRGTQIKNNRYYVPDPALDETYMFLSYKTIESGVETQTPVFIEKTDNLLTVIDFKNNDGTTKLYFQFGVDDFDYPYIELSSYWADQFNADSVIFTFYYFKTQGNLGNITENYLSKMNAGTQNELIITNLDNNDFVVDSKGNYLCSPGFNPQTASEAYADSINYIMTYDTLVTIYDFTRFARRQDGVSNAFACDGQYAYDLNRKLQEICNSYTKKQLLDILGSNIPELQQLDQATLAAYLYNIRKVTYNYADCPATIQEAANPTTPENFKNYGLNICPIWENFITIDTATGKQIARYTNLKNINDPSSTLPYFLYYINTQDNTSGSDPDEYKIETLLDEAIDKTRIVNVRPEYTALRVFPWRCCGTLHLTQTVTELDAQNILKAVVNKLATVYKPENMTFGKKLTYMEIIDTILSSDPRIRYFDAGIGDKKLIYFGDRESGFFNVDAYFNPISVMRYVQTYQEITDENSDFYNMLCIDPSYIQTTTTN